MPNNRDSDPPVSIPPLASGDLVITAGTGAKTQTLTIKAQGKKLKLVVTVGGTKFETPIVGKGWSLDILEA